MVVEPPQRGNLVREKAVMVDMVKEQGKAVLIVIEERYLNEK
jgi:hypothetical protein